MTVIVAVQNEKEVVMGGDCAGVGWNYDIQMRSDPKVFRVGRFVIGYTSSFRMGQLLRFGLHGCLRLDELNPPDDSSQCMSFMANDFIPRTRWLLKQGGYTEINSNNERAGQFLVAWGSQLFSVESDFQIGESMNGYAACGCGWHIALGALHANATLVNGIDRVQSALQAAAHHSAGVRAPFTILSTLREE